MTNVAKTKQITNPFGPTKPEDAVSIIKSHVDRLFKDAAPLRGQLCENPVIGGYFVFGEDPIAPQKRMVHRALLAREWFAQYGPQDAQPLPISFTEIEKRNMRGTTNNPRSASSSRASPALFSGMMTGTSTVTRALKTLLAV